MSEPKYKHVMLIDDNEVDNFAHRKIIENAGFASEITVVESGRAGLEKLTGMGEDKLPQIVFLDIMMPVMDGFEFLEEFDKLDTKIKSKCKVVMLSTSESFKDLNRANKNIYVQKFLNKPLSDAMLKAINL